MDVLSRLSEPAGAITKSGFELGHRDILFRVESQQCDGMSSGRTGRKKTKRDKRTKKLSVDRPPDHLFRTRRCIHSNHKNEDICR